MFPAFRSRAARLVAPALVLAAASCDANPSTTPRELPVPTRVELSEEYLSLPIGAEEAVAATVYDQFGDRMAPGAYTLSWTSEDPGVAAVQGGRVRGNANGLVAVSAQVGSVSSGVSVRVNGRGVSVAITPRADTLDAIGAKTKLNARLSSSAGTTAAIRWASLDADVATVDSAGGIHAVGTGVARIVATAQQAGSSPGGNVASADTARVIVRQLVAAVRVGPVETIDAIGDSLQLSAGAYDANGHPVPATQMTWTSLTPAIATVTASGRVASRAVGIALVTAAASGRADTARVVSQQVVDSVRVTPTTVSIPAGQKLQLNAMASDRNGVDVGDARYEWSVADAKVASISEGGQLTATAQGSTKATVRVDGKSTTIPVQVTAPAPQPVATVTIAPTAASIQAGQGTTLAATLRDVNGNVLTGRTVSWSSSNTAIATVANGAVSGVGQGTATITATSEGRSGTATVTVFGAPTPPPAPPGGTFVQYPSEDIAFILGPQLVSGSSANPWPWFDQNMVTRGLHFAQDAGSTDTYYDYALTQYIAYYRTGDARHLNAARQSADSWYQKRKAHGTGTAPRSLAAGGIIMRALETNNAEMWKWLVDWARAHDQSWLSRHYNRAELWFGVRDGAYTMLYMAQLGRVHPDPAIRTEMLDRARKAATLYYARLQQSDGGWYWTDSEFVEKGRFSQPFQIGLLLEALTAVHQLTGDLTIANAIVSGTQWLWERGYREDVVPERPDVTWRGMYYWVHPDGSASGETNLKGGWDLATIREVRQLSSTAAHAFGYAYKISRDAKFLQWGDEVFAATFGKGQGPYSDPFYNLADFRAKEYNQSYRSAGRYLVWRLGQ